MRSLVCLFLVCFSGLAAAFTTVQKPQQLYQQVSSSLLPLYSTTDATNIDTDNLSTTEKGLFKRDRYIATNRFSVRRGQNIKFEARWLKRKSRLAQLEGFKYFQVMRRVKINESKDGVTYDEGENDEAAMGNYVSFTIWNKKSDFSAWRSGEAFKEAHGGTSIGSFMSAMIGSALVLRGPPRPAFYDSLFIESTVPDDIPKTVNGWREVDIKEGESLPTESFVQYENYYIPQDKATEFEKAYLILKSSTSNSDGLVVSSLMRRDGQVKGHGVVEMTNSEPTYSSVHVFKNFDAWKEWSQEVSPSYECTQLSVKPPEKVFYEGTLVITSPEGA